MPFVLISLFSVALLVTLAGFFLSSRSQARDLTQGQQVRRMRSSYVVTRDGRRIVDAAAPVPLRSRRVASTMSQPVSIRAPRRPRIQARGSMISGGGDIVGRLIGPLNDPLRSWKVISLGLALIFIAGLYTFSLLFHHEALFASVWFATVGGNSSQTSQAQSAPPVYTATQNLVRLSQLDPSQYSSQAEYSDWAYSACSTTSMTEVINSYGHHYRITDILKVEAGIHEITPQLGLLNDAGIQRTGAYFGFKTTWGYNRSLDQVIAAANSGTPVIVSFPPSRYAGGHLLVVTGGDSNYVRLADSSLYNRHSLTRAQFMVWWGGFSAIMTPN